MTTSNPRIEVKDAVAGGWFGAREEANLPVRAGGAGLGARAAAPEAAKPDARSPQAWWRLARRVVLDLTIVLAAMTAIPVVGVIVNDGSQWYPGMGLRDSREKLRAIEPSRQFGVKKDPSISPLEAGRLFAGFPPIRETAAFPTIGVVHPEATWRTLKMDAGMFVNARSPSFNGPDQQTVLLGAAKGFSPAEMAYLRRLAEAPIWASFDRVARAERMDMLGGVFLLPFKASASEPFLPIMAFGGSKELAYAAVSRAAYHMAIGQRDSAETILRSIISYGFTISDNGPGLIYQLIGRVIAGVGREALEQYFVITKDPRAAAVIAARPADVLARLSDTPKPDPQSVSGMEKELLARATNPNELQGVRYQALELLSFSQCTNVRELLLGRSPDVTRAFDQAKRDLARYPSERALIDLIQRTPQSRELYADFAWGPARKFLYGASTIAGTVLRNPRLAECTWYVTEGRLGF